MKKVAEVALTRCVLSPPSSPATAQASAPTVPAAADAASSDEAAANTAAEDTTYAAAPDGAAPETSARSLPDQTRPPSSAPADTAKASRKQRRTKEEILQSYNQPYAQAISQFCKHGIENQTSTLKVLECKALLTLGFGIKATGKLSELRQRVAEQLAKGRSDDAFWRSMAAGGREEGEPGGGETNPPPALHPPPASSPPPLAIGSCRSLIAGCDGEPRGQKRSREGGALPSLVPPPAPGHTMPSPKENRKSNRSDLPVDCCNGGPL